MSLRLHDVSGVALISGRTHTQEGIISWGVPAFSSRLTACNDHFVHSKIPVNHLMGCARLRLV